MITKIENALVERLQRGLGSLAATVKTYSGELDDESIGTARLPLVLVSFGGARIERKNLQARRHQSHATFVVLVAVRSLRSDVAARQGGVNIREIGANQLISAVRRLLDAQTFDGLLAAPLLPVRVVTVLNGAKVRSERLTAYSIEFTAVYHDTAPLEDGRFPEETDDPDNPDFVFNRYQGELSTPDPWFERLNGELTDPTLPASLPINLNLEKSDEN